MSISQLASQIAESPTLVLNEKARLLREKGEAVIHLGAGEPKSKAPFEALLAASAQLSTAEVRYTPTEGVPSLIKAVIRYMEENYNKFVGPRNVIVSGGAKQSLAVLLTTIINPQDEVVILAPYWVSYPEMVKMVYGIPVIVTPEDGRFEPTMEDITQVVGSYTKAIIVNSPNNPSGAVYSEDLIAELVTYCEKKGIYLIMDDIYHKLVFDNKKVPSPYQFATDDSENSKLVVINGVSKLYAMTGFRIGWTIANRKVIETMINVQAQTTTCPPLPSQLAAVGAINGPQSNVENMRLTLQNNRDIMMQELEAFDGVRISKPSGTFYCLPDFRAYRQNSVELSDFLLEKVMVVTVPGGEFGMEGHLRLSYCGSVKEIMDGVARIKWALDPNSPNEIFIGDRKLVRDWL
ncbi:MAG: aminotransferase class I/II-fold pyridoxal phosphate-dependent enzyme [candidate division Zixibacteria bacterium]|nr:aminotransferase class I/II-fold pyridoxal phosphate-dependent enzyme [candidate division Zixibacteria bacterium]